MTPVGADAAGQRREWRSGVHREADQERTT
jgi:hypothetical protein